MGRKAEGTQKTELWRVRMRDDLKTAMSEMNENLMPDVQPTDFAAYAMRLGLIVLERMSSRLDEDVSLVAQQTTLGIFLERKSLYYRVFRASLAARIVGFVVLPRIISAPICGF